MVHNADTEKWKPVIGMEQWFEVSSHGRIRSHDHYATRGKHTQFVPGRLLTQHPNKWGYLCVTANRHGKRVRIKVHRAVAEAFVDGFFSGATVDHLDGHKRHNHASNLEWVTNAENASRMRRDGRGVGYGENHPLSRYTDRDIALMRKARDIGMSNAMIARAFRASDGYVSQILSQKRRQRMASPEASDSVANASG